jgi:hypothetical protein
MPMRAWLWALSFTVWLAGAPAWAADWTPYVRLDAFAHAQPVPIQDYLKDWDAPLKKNADALTRNRVETGVRYGNWRVAYVQSFDYELKASRETAAFYHQVRNRIPFASGQRFALDLDPYHLRRQGLRLAHRWQLGPVAVEPAVNLLQGIKLIDGRVRGLVTTQGGGNYDYEAAVDYTYSEDDLFDREVAAPSGKGLSLDLNLAWTPAPGWLLRAEMTDLLGEMHWRDAPRTLAIASSDNKEFDEQGFVRYRPALSGREFNQDFTQRIRPQAQLFAEWAVDPVYTVGAQWRLTEVGHYPGLNVRRRFTPRLSLQFESLPVQRAYGLGLRYRQFSLDWLSDRLQFDDAHLLQVRLGGAWTF